MPYADPLKKKEYKTLWNKKYYKENTEKEKKRIFGRRDDLVKWLKEYKSRLSCVICGENTPICLDFHHKDKDTKEFTLGGIRRHGWGLEKMKKEIEKCIVLCSNCHKKIHAGLVKI